MSLMKSLNSGVSGLRSFQVKMDVIGNNIANVNTTGFKTSKVNFAEVMNQNISKSGVNFNNAPSTFSQVGLGVRVSSIDRDFAQGTLSATNVSTDLAIQGDGFFVVNNGVSNKLTRAGNFQFNKDGFLVTANGMNVQGFNANSRGNIVTGGSTQNVKIDFADVYAPQRTQNIRLAGNLNSNTSTAQTLVSSQSITTNSGTPANNSTLLANIDQVTSALADGDEITITGFDGDGNAVNYTFVVADVTTFTMEDFANEISAAFPGATASLRDGNFILRSDTLGNSQLNVTGIEVTTGAGEINFPNMNASVVGSTNSRTISSTVYDGLGEAHALVVEIRQIDFNSWAYEARFLGSESVTNNATGTLEFDNGGRLIGVNGSFAENIVISFDPANGAAPQNFSLIFNDPANGGLTQFDGASSANFVSQDGFGKGELIDFFVDSDGIIVGAYSNGKSKNLAQIALGNVINPNGLVHQGDGLFATTAQAGELIVSPPAILPGTTVNSGFLESSNVDLAQEFTEMIITQRAYQSSARVITTADQLLQEVTQLKR